MAFTYTCPYCNRHTTLTDADIDTTNWHPNATGRRGEIFFRLTVYVCPNPECFRERIVLAQFEARRIGNSTHFAPGGDAQQTWPIEPASRARPFPEFVPSAIRSDYEEACAVVELSPKASATLSRRALQGIMRDFFDAKGANLKEEINAAEKSPLMPVDLVAALHAVREIGNIGAHMEKASRNDLTDYLMRIARWERRGRHS